MRKIVSLCIKLTLQVCKVAIKAVLLLIGHEILARNMAEAHTRALVKREVNAHMNEFLGVLSHDLRTPLTSIKGNLQLISRRLHANPIDSDETKTSLDETQEILKRTNTQVNRLTLLINSLLESARIHANTMDLLFELCELDLLLRETVEERRGLPAERTIESHVPEGRTVLIMADASRIKQVIYHYLSNAHKYSPITTTIEIHLHVDGNTAYLQMRDSGLGIPRHEQSRIWERYYRVSTNRVLNGSSVGLGLGLHICRTIIEQHHGRVGVFSEPGHGSTFWFALPIVSDHLS